MNELFRKLDMVTYLNCFCQSLHLVHRVPDIKHNDIYTHNYNYRYPSHYQSVVLYLSLSPSSSSDDRILTTNYQPALTIIEMA